MSNGGVMAIPKQKLIEEFLQNTGDIITSKQITKAGFHRGVLSRLVETHDIEKVAREVHAIYN